MVRFVLAALAAALVSDASAQPIRADLDRGLLVSCAFDPGPARPGDRAVCEPVGARPVPDRRGRPAAAIQLDGVRSYVLVRARVAPQRFTLAAWIRPDATDRAGVIVSKIHNVPGAYQKNFELRLDPGGRLFLHVPSGTGWEGVAGQRVVAPGRWTHVAAVYDGARAQLYVNGIPDGAPLSAPVYAQTEDDVTAGARPEGGGRDGRTPSGPSFFFAGALDDLRIYDRPLSVAEVGALAAAEEAPAPVPAPGPGPGADDALIAHYPLDGDARDAAGGTAGRMVAAAPAEDRSGNPRGAIGLDGRGFVDLGTRTEPANVTLAAWAWPTRLGREMAVFSKTAADGGRERTLELRIEADGRPALAVPTERRAVVRADRPLAPGRWTHLAATFDGARAALWVDGELAAEAPVAGWRPAPGPAFLGARPDPRGRRARAGTAFEGRLDDVRIYRVALDGRAIRALVRPEERGPGGGERADDARDLLRVDRLLARFDDACVRRDAAALRDVEARVLQELDAERREARGERAGRDRLARLERAASDFASLRGRTDGLSLDRKRSVLAELSEAAWLELADELDGATRWNENAIPRDRDRDDHDDDRWP